MPYIKPDDRERIIAQLRLPQMANPGTLNYVLTKVCQRYLECRAGATGEYRYQHFNDIVGAMECCKLELYRRLIAKMEDKKCAENGDVY